MVRNTILSVDDMRKSDVSGTDITIHDNVVLAFGKRITANELNEGSVSVDTLRKQDIWRRVYKH